MIAKPTYEMLEKRVAEQVLSGQHIEAFETIRYRKDGTPLHVIAAGSPIAANVAGRNGSAHG